MKNTNYLLILVTGLFVFMSSTLIYAQKDDPNLDQIPEDFLQHQANENPMPSSVVTINGYDNYFLGVDFAEGHISENPLQAGEYFVAFNIDDTHYTMDGHDWYNSNVSWSGYYIRGDVLTAYDADGNLYYENMYGSSIQGCVVVKSSDNGQTWSSPVVAISGVDKNWMTADMTSGPYSSYVYTVMTRSGGGNFARSTNGGASFSTTFQPSTQSLPGMMVCVGADGGVDGGSVYVVTNSGSAFSSTYTFYESNDGGATFSYKSAQSWAGYVGTNVNGRNSVENMRTRPYPFITADNSNGTYRGRLYCIYASNVPAGNGNKPDIFSRFSDDGGSSWSSAVTVNDDMPSTGNSQWQPAPWCDYETGRLYVQWMDTRDCPTSDSALIYSTYSDDGGQTFALNQAISNEKMKINCYTCGGGGTPRYQGDYNAIISNADVSMSTWSDFRNGNFATYTAYFPDYAMGISPDVSQVSGGIASFDCEVPSVKLYTNDVVFTAEIEPPSSGSFTIDFPGGNTLSSFPGSIQLDVIVNGNVPTGFYELTLTGKGPNGTPVHIRTAMVEVVPLTPPTAEFSATPTVVCANSTVNFTDESTGFPDTWDWTFEGGTPSTSAEEDPVILYDTPGIYDVSLTVSNSAGSNTNDKPDYIEVLVIPNPPTSSDEEACFGDPVPDLTAVGTMVQWYDDASLTNLVHSGSVFATGQTLPGSYTYYATQTDGGCESIGLAVTLTIHDLPDVTLALFSPVCLDVAPFTLTGGLPAGGSYSGAGVSNNTFDPAAAGAGTHDITYIYTDISGCSNDASQTITVYDLPVVTFDPIPDVCLNGSPDELTEGTPAGGTYSGTGVTNGYFYPDVAGIGSHLLTYTYTDGNGCTNHADQYVQVNDILYPNLGPDSVLCAGQSITLDATITGAVQYLWYPGGQTTPSIVVDSTGIGLGSKMFKVFVTDADNCVNNDSITIGFKDCSAINELAGINSINLYPNPGQGVFSLEFNTENNIEVNVKVYNSKGDLIQKEEALRIENSYLLRMDLSNQPSGIYFVTVYNNEGQWVEKLVIRK